MVLAAVMEVGWRWYTQMRYGLLGGEEFVLANTYKVCVCRFAARFLDVAFAGAGDKRRRCGATAST